MKTPVICPKCHERLHLDYDIYGWYAGCIMCGYIRDIEPHPDRQEQFQEPAEPALAAPAFKN